MSNIRVYILFIEMILFGFNIVHPFPPKLRKSLESCILCILTRYINVELLLRLAYIRSVRDLQSLVSSSLMSVVAKTPSTPQSNYVLRGLHLIMKNDPWTAWTVLQCPSHKLGPLSTWAVPSSSSWWSSSSSSSA